MKIRRKLPTQITAFAGTPLAWHTTADICAWRDAAHGDEFLTVRGKVVTLPEGAQSPVQLVINCCRFESDSLLNAFLDALVGKCAVDDGQQL